MAAIVGPAFVVSLLLGCNELGGLETKHRRTLSPEAGETEAAEIPDPRPKDRPWGICREAAFERIPWRADIPWAPQYWGWKDDDTVEIKFELSYRYPDPFAGQPPNQARCLVTFEGDEVVDYSVTFQ